MSRKKISEDALLAAADIDGAVDYIPIVDPSEAEASNRNKRSLLNSIADWVVKTATSFVQSGTGALTETLQAAVRRFVHTAQYSTQANYDTALDALTGTFGVGTLDVRNGITIGPVAAAGSSTLLVFETADAGSANFNVAMGDFTFNGQVDSVFRLGYNIANGGGRADTSEPAWALVLESNYESVPSTNLMELHFEGVHADGTAFRNWSWNVNRSTKAIGHAINADSISFVDGTGVNQYMSISGITTVAAVIGLNSGTSFVHGVNNATWLKQLNAAGNAFVELMNLNSSNQVAIAPAAGGVLLNNALTISGKTMSLDQPSSGADVFCLIANDSNTANSRALFDARVFGSSAGDAMFRAYINGGTIWSWGLDNSDSDNFKISGDAALGTSDALVITATGLNVGIGTGTFGTNAAGVFAVKNGTVPTTGPADTVQFYSSDIAAGHTEPSFFCEGTQVLATGQADSASSVRVKMRINGTEVTLLAI